MSTPSIIAIRNDDGSLCSIQCRYDGHPRGVGQTLVKSWGHEARVRSLLELGDLSRLGFVKGRKRPFDLAEEIVEACTDEDGIVDWEAALKDERYIQHQRACLSYKRDREDVDAEPVVYGSWAVFAESMLQRAPGARSGYIYVFDVLQGQWLGVKDGVDITSFESLLSMEQLTEQHEAELRKLERVERVGLSRG